MKKKFKKELEKYSALIMLFTLIPLIIYFIVFIKNGLSIDTTNWSEFGDFIGGYGSLIIGAGNLYFLIKLSYKLSQIDDDRNNQNKIDSVKPLGIINYNINFKNRSYKLVIKNLGLGPLVVKNYYLQSNNVEYKNISEYLVSNQLYLDLYTPLNDNILLVGANNLESIIELTFEEEKDREVFEYFVYLMKSVKFTFECEDLFENKVELFTK